MLCYNYSISEFYLLVFCPLASMTMLILLTATAGTRIISAEIFGFVHNGGFLEALHGGEEGIGGRGGGGGR